MVWLLLLILAIVAARYIKRAGQPDASGTTAPHPELPVATSLRHASGPMGKNPRPDDVGIVDIPSVGFFVQYAYSPSGRFFLGFQDGHLETRGSRTIQKKGFAALLEDGKLRWKKILQRPMCGAVADDGTSVIGDTQNNELKSRLYVFSATEQALIDHRIKANIWNCAISSDGSIAVCQTCNSDNDDGNALFIFDVRQTKLLVRVSPKTGWADGYRFDLAQRRVTLTYRDGSAWCYGFDGAFLDHGLWIEKKAGAATLVQMAKALESSISSKDDVAFREFGRLLALAETRADSDSLKARIHRQVGEMYQKLGDTAEAMRSFEAALTLDPKVGVKTLLKRLQSAS